jgi:hypothetical protein
MGVDPDDENRKLVEIREDVIRAPDEPGKPPVLSENTVTVSI